MFRQNVFRIIDQLFHKYPSMRTRMLLVPGNYPYIPNSQAFFKQKDRIEIDFGDIRVLKKAGLRISPADRPGQGYLGGDYRGHPAGF